VLAELGRRGRRPRGAPNDQPHPPAPDPDAGPGRTPPATPPQPGQSSDRADQLATATAPPPPELPSRSHRPRP
jgi:hypothetical protein